MSFQLIGGRFQAFTNAGGLLVGGLLYTYASGTTTPKATYTDGTLGASNTNPVVLNARGEAQVWLGTGAYTFVLKDSLGVTIWSVDGVSDGSEGLTALAASLLDGSSPGLGADLVGYTATTTVRDRLSQLSLVQDFGCVLDGTTDDGAALGAAAQASHQSGAPLFFPSGFAYAAASVSNLHDATWIGGGKIKRTESAVDYIWRLNPDDTQTNTLYVATTGNDTNDGISPAYPMATVAHALAVIASRGPALYAGIWVVKVAAGTYTEGVIDFPVVLGNKNAILIQGPVVNHPNVPTAIFDGASTLAYGLNFNSRARAVVSNLKFINFVTFGIVGQDLADVTTKNVHVDGGGVGIKMQQGRLRVQGGIVKNCGIGIEAIGGTTFTIGDPNLASRANGTQVLTCTTQGILAQEQSSGHVDFVTVTNCAVGLDAQVHSRFHAQGCAITANATAAVRCVDGSSWLDNGTSANFATNGVNELIYDAVGEIGRDGSRTLEQKQPIDITFATLSGTTAATTVKTYASAIAANSFNTSVKSYRLLAYGELTGASTKTLAVKVAGTALGTFTLAGGAASYEIEAVMHGQSASAQSYHLACRVNGQSTQILTGPSSIAMVTGSAIAVTLVGQLSNSGDSLTVRGVEQYNYGGC